MAWADARYPRAKRLPGDWQSRRLKVLRRDRGQCQIRGPRCTGTATEVDHVRAGDDHELPNLQAVCKSCHNLKTATESSEAARAQRQRFPRKRPPERHPGLIDPGSTNK